MRSKAYSRMLKRCQTRLGACMKRARIDLFVQALFDACCVHFVKTRGENEHVSWNTVPPERLDGHPERSADYHEKTDCRVATPAESAHQRDRKLWALPGPLYP